MILEKFENPDKAKKFLMAFGYAKVYSKIIKIIKGDWGDKSIKRSEEHFLYYWNTYLTNTPKRPYFNDYSIGYILVMYLINKLKEM